GAGRTAHSGGWPAPGSRLCWPRPGSPARRRAAGPARAALTKAGPGPTARATPTARAAAAARTVTRRPAGLAIPAEGRRKVRAWPGTPPGTGELGADGQAHFRAGERVRRYLHL